MGSDFLWQYIPLHLILSDPAKFHQRMRQLLLVLGILLSFSWTASSQSEGLGNQLDDATVIHDEQEDDHVGDQAHDDAHHGGEFDPTSTAFHHIADQNVYSIGPWAFPLPCILYAKGEGFSIFSSSNFDIGHHGTGHNSYKGYVLYEGIVRRVPHSEFPKESVPVHLFHKEEMDDSGKERQVVYAKYDGKQFKTDAKSTLDGGLLGGGLTSFYDFSLTKNVVTMLLVSILLFWMFFTITKAYRNREGKAPKGIQSFIEPIFLFIQDEVAKPFLGPKWKTYLPFIMSLFFFIWALNMFGQIPFFGSSNVTGNLAVTMALALFTFVVVNLSGNWNYWKHIFWMPGAPAAIKLLILTPVEVMGLFIKPLTLMLRLFANMTAGHMVVLSFVGLIFIFGQSGESVPGTMVGTLISVPLTLFMMAIELLVAFVQAFVFAILTASYIGSAIEEHH
jgi:F-type H+-transporting ATPase subunit a